VRHIIIAFVLPALVYLCSGCDSSVSADRAAILRLSDEIQLIRESLTKNDIKYPHHELVARINERMSGISNKNNRAEGAYSYAQMLKNADIATLPYRRRSAAASLYGRHICFSFRLMMMNGVDPQDAMSVFFDCLFRYREACFSISAAARNPNERLDEYAQRQECARGMSDAYGYTVSVIKRFWLPNLSEYLPNVYHEEFRRRFESLSE